MNDRMEETLRQALQRKEAPEGFAERVLAAAARQPQAQAPRAATPARGWTWWTELFSRPAWALAFAAALVAIVLGGLYWQNARREAALEQARLEAKQEVLFALRLTKEKTAPARKVLAELGLRLADPSTEQNTAPARP